MAWQLLRRFAGDRSGNIAIMGAGVMTLVLGCTALGVDVGTIFADRRKAQSVADLAAIVAASNLGNAYNAASATVVQNKLPASALLAVDLGTYTANSGVAPQARFVAPAAGVTNAARVSVQMQTPLYFARLFTGSNAFTITTSATASNTAIASFWIGSRLASLNGGLLNAMLGALLGTSVSLSAMDYRALADARIDAFDFLSGVATRANVTGGSYDNLLSANLKVSDILAATLATQQATNGASPATTALSSLSRAASSLSTKASLRSLVDLGPYGGMTTDQRPQVGVKVSLFDLVSAIAQVANGKNQVAAAVDLGLPGITSASLMATIGERPAGSSWIAVGNEGATVHTAQTRLLLTLKIGGSGLIPSVNLPLYVEVAQGTATLDSVSCTRPDVSNSSVTLGVTPGVVDAWIGTVAPAQMMNFASKPTATPATLVSVAGLNVNGIAHAQIANTSPTPTRFSYSEINPATIKTVSTRNFTSSLTASLLGDLSLSVAGIGLPIGGLTSSVTNLLFATLPSIDLSISSVLAALGVGVGQADVSVNGIRCDGAVLVN
ncbi:pilus assembly protein TadG-related protein [Rhodopseudomonas sp. HC1]|uniref:pilus assembly protein TadG-related protein n=1 Tax=Rhodopseudomonas infernalis TaxID=2897386 RepID=UPI001EE7E973|nr:pilus assembly protein TadG-related protein [Rhodopseudomonas infernalis]MCG6204251.1 pilus assembly protein TadG-related protein [Rhodopseudomonas infernalis]